MVVSIRAGDGQEQAHDQRKRGGVPAGAHATRVWQRHSAAEPSWRATLASFGLWRSLVARSVRVGEVAGSNPVSPIAGRGPSGAVSLVVARGSPWIARGEPTTLRAGVLVARGARSVATRSQPFARLGSHCSVSSNSAASARPNRCGQDSSFAEKQESHPALLLVVHTRSRPSPGESAEFTRRHTVSARRECPLASEWRLLFTGGWAPGLRPRRQRRRHKVTPLFLPESATTATHGPGHRRTAPCRANRARRYALELGAWGTARSANELAPRSISSLRRALQECVVVFANFGVPPLFMPGSLATGPARRMVLRWARREAGLGLVALEFGDEPLRGLTERRGSCQR